MKFVRQFSHYITAVFFITIIIIVATSYFTFKEVVGIHHQRQQDAIIPLFALVTSEIIHPLSVSQFMANDQLVIEYVLQDKIDENKLRHYLTHYAEQYQMLTFIALEKHNLMLDSNNKQDRLDAEEAEWFHRLKASPERQFADIGNAEDPHLYFDVKMFNQDKEFIGFIGAAVDLNYFAQRFDEFNRRFGYELYFVDENNSITLSSSHLMKTESHHRRNEIVKIDDLPWYKAFSSRQQANTIENNNSDQALVSKMPIQELNWQLYIVSPPASQQREYWQLFFSRFVIFVLITMLAYFIFINLINYFKSSVVKGSHIDFLTKLPNRSYIHWKYGELVNRYDNASIVVADIDHFKQINDNYGHTIGDQVLKTIATQMSSKLRQVDLIARWGGEEFLMILPDTSVDQASEITERIRQSIEQTSFDGARPNQSFNATISFGISHTMLEKNTLDKVIAEADQALYIAKANGRNQLVVYSG